MKTRAMSLALLLLAGAAGAASAQDQDHHRREGWRGQGHEGQRPAQQGQAQPAQQPQQAPQAPQAPPAREAGAPRHGGDGRGGWRPQDGGRFGGGGEARPDARPAPVQRSEDRGERSRPDWNRGEGQRDWNRDGRGDRGDRYGGRGDPRETRHWAPHQYPQRYRSQQRYRAPAWHAPRGYYSRAWRFGEILPRGWYGRDYWIPMWWEFDLPGPPPGYHWVRIGTDALLVDDFDGRIVQVVDDIFW